MRPPHFQRWADIEDIWKTAEANCRWNIWKWKYAVIFWGCHWVCVLFTHKIWLLSCCMQCLVESNHIDYMANYLGTHCSAFVNLYYVVKSKKIRRLQWFTLQLSVFSAKTLLKVLSCRLFCTELIEILTRVNGTFRYCLRNGYLFLRVLPSCHSCIQVVPT